MGARRAKQKPGSRGPRRRKCSPRMAANFLDTGLLSIRQSHVYIGSTENALMACVTVVEKCMRQALAALGEVAEPEPDHPGQKRLDG